MQFVQSISCVLFLFATLEASVAQNSTTVLPIVGFFPWYSNPLWPAGIRCIPAALLAVEEINQITDLIPGYNLSLTYYDYDGGTANGAVKQYIEGVANNKTAPIALLAPGTSSAALKIASLTSQSERNLVQVSYGATNPSLSNHLAYPYFLRTVPNQLTLTKALAEFVNRNNWSRITAIYQGIDTILRSTAYNFRTNLPHLHIPLYSIQESDESLVSGELEVTLEQIKQHSNIIFAFVYGTLIDNIMEAAHNLDMSNQNYVWVFPEQSKEWWNCSDCSWYNDNVYLFDSQYSIGEDDDTVELPSGNNISEYRKLLGKRTKTFIEEKLDNRSVDETDYVHSSYDAMWAIALGLNLTQNVLSASNKSLHDYQKYPMLVSDTLLQMLRQNVSFKGASGNISFEEGSIEAPVVLRQIVMDGTDKYRQKAYVYSDHTLEVHNVKGELPQDEFKEITTKIHEGEFVVILLTTVLFVVLNSALVFINVKYKNYRIIRSTSPNLNLFLFSGHYMLLLFVVLLSIINFFPDKLLSVSNIPFDLACNFLPWLLTVGFSLVLVTLFVKYCRLYLIFSAKRKTVVHNKLSDRLLMTCIVGIILVADVIPMVVLNAVNPLENHTHVVIDSVTGSKNSTFTCVISMDARTELEVFYGTIGWILLIKALLALSLFYFTFKLRNITVYDDLFNDSGSVFTFMFLELILLVVCTIFLVLRRAPNDIHSLYYALTLGILLTFASATVILFGYKYRKFFRKKFSQLCSHRRAQPLVSPEPLHHNVVLGQLQSPVNVTPWHSRYRSRQSLSSMYSSPSPSPRTSINSVRFSPSPPEVNLYTNSRSVRGSHGFADSRDSSISSMRYNFNPYFS